jgi:hypothetical protein
MNTERHENVYRRNTFDLNISYRTCDVTFPLSKGDVHILISAELRRLRRVSICQVQIRLDDPKTCTAVGISIYVILHIVYIFITVYAINKQVLESIWLVIVGLIGLYLLNVSHSKTGYSAVMGTVLKP